MRSRVQRAPGLPCVPLGIALRPLVFWGERHANLGQTMSRERRCSSSSATGSRECAPDDRLRRMIQYSEELVIEPRTRGILDTSPEPVIGLAEGETRWRSMTVLGGASARWSGWRLTFVPGKPVSTLDQAGWLVSESCFWVGCTKSVQRVRSAHMPAPGWASYNLAIQRISAFGCAPARIPCLIRRKRPAPRQSRLNDTRKLL
jgi:hypothetical protein